MTEIALYIAVLVDFLRFNPTHRMVQFANDLLKILSVFLLLIACVYRYFYKIQAIIEDDFKNNAHK